MASAIGRITLLNSEGGDRHSFPLAHSHLSIGRLPSCDVRIQLPSVSKLHAEIELDPKRGRGSLEVKSANGVRSQNKLFRLGETMPLEDGSIFTISGRTFRINLVKEQQPKEVSPASELIEAQETPAPLLSTSPSARSLFAALVSPFGFGSSTPKPAPKEAATEGDLIHWSEGRTHKSNESPVFPGALREDKPSNGAAEDSSDSSDEEIERHLVSPRSSLVDSERSPLPPPAKFPNGVARRHSLREKVLIRSAVRTHTMQRSYSTGSMSQLTSPTPLPRRSSLPLGGKTVKAVTVANTEEQDVPLSEVDAREYERDLVETESAQDLRSRSASSSPEPEIQTRQSSRRRSDSASSSDSDPSPRALRAARRSSLTEESLVTPSRPVRESTLSPSPESLERHVDSEVPLKTDAPATPRVIVKPRKSALKTPPPASSSSPDEADQATPTLKRKLSVNWDEKLERVKEIPHRLDANNEPLITASSVKKARIEVSSPAADASSAPEASTSLTASASRPTLIFVHEHPELNIPTTPSRTPTSAGRVKANRVPHSAGRAKRDSPMASSVQRAQVAPMTTGRMASRTPDRPVPARRPGRSVTPTRGKANIGDLQAPSLAELLKSPIPKLGSFHPVPETPKAVPQLVPVTPLKTPTAQNLMSRLENIKRSATKPNAAMPAIPKGSETPLISFDLTVEQKREVPATPNMTGLSRLFSQPQAPPKTPQFGGVRQLFALPSIADFSPALDGVKEMLHVPTPGAAAESIKDKTLLPERSLGKPAAPAKTASSQTARPPSASALPVRKIVKQSVPIKASAAVAEPKRALPLRKVVSKEVLRQSNGISAPSVSASIPRSNTGSSISSQGSDRETRSSSHAKKTVVASKTPSSTAARGKARTDDGEDQSPSSRATSAKVVVGKENSHQTGPTPVHPSAGRSAGSAKDPSVTRSGRILRMRKA